jgi:hypothetical protein
MHIVLRWSIRVNLSHLKIILGLAELIHLMGVKLLSLVYHHIPAALFYSLTPHIMVLL